MANADLEAGGWEVWPNTACISMLSSIRAGASPRPRKAADVSDGATPTVRSRALKMSTFANVQ